MAADVATPQGPPPIRPEGRLRPLRALALAWGTFRANLGLSLGALVVFWAIQVVLVFIPFVNVLFSFLVSPVLYAGYARFTVRLARGEKPTIGSLFDGFQRWPTVIGAMLVLGLVSFVILSPIIATAFATIGLEVLLHPASASREPSLAALLPLFASMAVCYPLVLVWMGRAWAAYFTVMETGCTGALDAIREAFALTRGNLWRAVGLMLLAIPMEIAGFVLLCVGIVPALAVYLLAWAHAYEQLRPQPAPVPPAPEPDPPPGIVV